LLLVSKIALVIVLILVLVLVLVLVFVFVLASYCQSELVEDFINNSNDILQLAYDSSKTLRQAQCDIILHTISTPFRQSELVEDFLIYSNQ